jgi:hypothetical protein
MWRPWLTAILRLSIRADSKPESRLIAPGLSPIFRASGKSLDGLSGELLVYIRAEEYAKTYNLRFGALSTDPESWTVLSIAGGKSAVSVKGLTPGVVYGFQVQALGNEGVTGWSDTFTHMSM